jgi:serine/threonine protein kinase
MEPEILCQRYQLIQHLGKGGFGTVYLAEDLRIKRQVAVKILHEHLNSNPKYCQRFLNEAHLIGSLQDTHTVTLFDCGQDETGRLFLVTELLQGESLEDRLHRGPLSAGECCRIFIPICHALSEAHDLGIIHRDFKPGNLFLSIYRSQLKPKLLDFGIAKMSGDLNLTQKSGLIGTPQYISPEQAKGTNNLTPAVDAYALGVTLYQSLSAQLPFENDSLLELLQAIVYQDPPLLPKHLDKDVLLFQPLIDSLLLKDPQQRLSDMRKIEQQLELIHAQCRDENAITVNLPQLNDQVESSEQPRSLSDKNSSVIHTFNETHSFAHTLAFDSQENSKLMYSEDHLLAHTLTSNPQEKVSPIVNKRADQGFDQTFTPFSKHIHPQMDLPSYDVSDPLQNSSYEDISEPSSVNSEHSSILFFVSIFAFIFLSSVLLDSLNALFENSETHEEDTTTNPVTAKHDDSNEINKSSTINPKLNKKTTKVLRIKDPQYEGSPVTQTKSKDKTEYRNNKTEYRNKKESKKRSKKVSKKRRKTHNQKSHSTSSTHFKVKVVPHKTSYEVGNIIAIQASNSFYIHTMNPKNIAKKLGTKRLKLQAEGVLKIKVCQTRSCSTFKNLSITVINPDF